MFEISIILMCVIALIVLKIFLNVKFKEINKLKNRDFEELNEISKKFSNDEKICSDILKLIKNKRKPKVKIEQEYNNSLYTVYNNTITIGKFRQNYMKIQTIAHECIHSNQDKNMLWSNFIFSNLYFIYFIIAIVLAFCNKLSNIHICIFIFMSFIQYILRYTLENEAMLNAKFVSKEYLEEFKLLNKDEEDKLLEEYDNINKIGIPFMNYYLISINLIKIIFLILISLI